MAGRRALGLRKIAPAGDAKDKTTIDIIAIHGLGTESPQTWKFKTEDADGRVVNWLADSNMLPAAVTEARIYTYDWNANCFEHAPVQTLLGHADTPLALISEHRGSEGRPIIFVASCFGGLILIEAINRAAREGSPYRDILMSTVGTLFLATPFQGSDASRPAKWYITVTQIMGEQSSDELIRSLEENHDFLVRRALNFTEIANTDSMRLPVSCFYETKATELLRRVLPRNWASWLSTSRTNMILVTETSACLHGFPRQGLDAPHSGMNKFDGPGSADFKLVKDAIRRVTDNASFVLSRRSSLTDHQPSSAPFCDDPAFIQNVHFVGRDFELATIHRHLSAASNQECQRGVCLWGPGGVGKTQLAVAYAFRYRHSHSEVFKVQATSPEIVHEIFGNLAFDILAYGGGGDHFTPQRPSKDSDAQTRQQMLETNIRMVHLLFGTHKTGNWLLVFDDVRLPEVDISRYIPRTKNGNIIITTQSRHATSYGVLVEVSNLAPDDAIALLLSKANLLDRESQDDIRPRAAEVAKLLAYLPLAVEHAGALIGCKGMQYYWENFHSDPVSILEQSEKTSIHQESVFKTFKMSFDVLAERSYCAAKFLVFLSFLDNSVVSSDALFDDGNVPKKSLEHMHLFQGKAEFHDAVDELHALALVKRREDGDKTLLSLHPLVHYMSRMRLNPTNQAMWTGSAARYLCWPYSQPSATTFQPSLSDFRNLIQILQHAPKLEEQEQVNDTLLMAWTLLAFLLAKYYPRFRFHAKIHQLKVYCKRALAVLEQGPGDHHFNLMVAMFHLVAGASGYTPTSESPAIAYRTFFSKLLKPAAAIALERAASPAGTGTEILAPVRFSWIHKPMTLRGVLKRPSPSVFVGQLFENMARLSVGEKRWQRH